MIYRPATPGDSPEMLRLIESHPARGGMKILYTRRPDAYKSYLTECPNAEITLRVNSDNRVLAQIACLPGKYYVNGEVQAIGYVTGLHKEDGVLVNIIKMLETGRKQSSVKQFFCSILDDNKPVYDLFAKRGLINPICSYTTYLLNPAALKKTKHDYNFRRAALSDSVRLLNFYKETGAEYSYFPLFESMNDFAELATTDFFLLEEGGEIIAAGALWNQQAYKQYVALDYRGAYKLVARCNPLLRLLGYPTLPKMNAAANFAYISFLLCRKNHLETARVFLGEIAAAARGYDFLAIGAVSGNEVEEILNGVKSIKFGSKLCAINYDKSGCVPMNKAPFRFECALL